MTKVSRFFENKSNKYRKAHCDHINVDLGRGRMGSRPAEDCRIAITRASGREIGVYLTEEQRLDLIKQLCRQGEWYLGQVRGEEK